MTTNDIQLHNEETPDMLSTRQIKMFEMLKDFHKTVTNENVKSVNPILEKHGFTTMLSTIMKSMEIFRKEKFIQWSYKTEATLKLAVRLDQYYQLYPRIVQSKNEFMDYLESQESFPIPLNKIWQLLEYEQYYNAKRSLLNNCEEGKDFVRLINEAKIAQNGQKDDEEEKFNLSRTGFQIFLLTAQKPMAKLFARLMIELLNQRNDFYLKVNSGITHLSEKANLLGDLEESIRHLQRFFKNLSDEVHTISCDPQQLLFGFEKDATRNAVAKVYDEARDLAMRIYKVDDLLSGTRGNKALPVSAGMNRLKMLAEENNHKITLS